MIKKLILYVKEYKKNSLLAPLFVSVEVVMEVLIPMMMALIVDYGLEKKDITYITKIGVLMVIMALCSLMFGALSGKHAAIAASGFAKNLRKAMYYNIQDFSFSNIDHFSTSSLVTRLTTDVTNVQNAYQMIIRMLVRAPIMLIFALIMSYTISPELTLIFAFIIPFLGCSLYFIMSNAHPNFMKMFKKYDLVNQVVQEDLTAIRTVKSFVREDFETKKFTQATQALYQYSINAEKLLAFNMPVMQFSVYTSILLISWFGAHLVISSTMSTGQLMSLFTYVMQILSSLMMISMAFVSIIMSKASAQRIIEVLEENSTLANNKNPLYNVEDGSIVFDHVDFSYNDSLDNLNLTNINLSIKSGETVGIIGSTGSAKTTLVQLIPRLYDVTRGNIFVGGHNVKLYDLETLRNSVAMVLQKNILFSGTIKDNLKWGNSLATDKEVIKAAKLAQADEFIQTFKNHYNTILDQGGTNVSGGQKQRLCITRALLKKPKILILDDSTSAVDTKTDTLIRQAFKEEIPNTTKIIIAQRISSIQHANTIIVLNEGKIDGIGKHDDLIKTNHIYKEVYLSQQKERANHE